MDLAQATSAVEERQRAPQEREASSPVATVATVAKVARVARVTRFARRVPRELTCAYVIAHNRPVRHAERFGTGATPGARCPGEGKPQSSQAGSPRTQDPQAVARRRAPCSWSSCWVRPSCSQCSSRPESARRERPTRLPEPRRVTGASSVAPPSRRSSILTGEIQAVRANECLCHARRPGKSRSSVGRRRRGGRGGRPDRSSSYNNEHRADHRDKRLRVRGQLEAEISLETPATMPYRRLNATETARVERAAGIEADKARLDAACPRTSARGATGTRCSRRCRKRRRPWLWPRSSSVQAEIADRAEAENLRLALEKARRDLETSETALAALSARAPADGIVIIEDYCSAGARTASTRSATCCTPASSWRRCRTCPRWRSLPGCRTSTSKVRGEGWRLVASSTPTPTWSSQGDGDEVGAVSQQQSDSSGFGCGCRWARADPERLRPGMSVRLEVVPANLARRPRRASGRDPVGQDVTRLRLAGRDVDVTIAGCTPSECVVQGGVEEGMRVRL